MKKFAESVIIFDCVVGASKNVACGAVHRTVLMMLVISCLIDSLRAVHL